MRIKQKKLWNDKLLILLLTRKGNNKLIIKIEDEKKKQNNTKTNSNYLFYKTKSHFFPANSIRLHGIVIVPQLVELFKWLWKWDSTKFFLSVSVNDPLI